jgi:hypothetical protein
MAFVKRVVEVCDDLTPFTSARRCSPTHVLATKRVDFTVR